MLPKVIKHDIEIEQHGRTEFVSQCPKSLLYLLMKLVCSEISSWHSSYYFDIKVCKTSVKYWSSFWIILLSVVAAFELSIENIIGEVYLC